MKSTNLTSTFKNAVIAVFVMLTFAGVTFAQTSSDATTHHQLTELDIVNLKAGIKSNINGVKRDCIYYAAIYNIKEAVEPLNKQLKEEENPSMRVLISLALYKLSDDSSIKSVNNEILLDWRDKVSSISNAIISENLDHTTGVASSR